MDWKEPWKTARRKAERRAWIRRVTAITVAAAITGLVLAELLALLAGGPGSTISELVWEWVDHRPWLSFFAGLLCGHWFWPRNS